jgi:nitroreductase
VTLSTPRATDVEGATPVIETMLAHTSVRRFRPDAIPEAHVDLLVEAMRRAPTSSAMQTTTVVLVTDPAVRRSLRPHAGGQAWVAECPLFIVSSVDLRRNDEITRERGHVNRAGDLRVLISATEDIAIAMQNASLAAQSLGYGSVMIGGVLNGTREIAEVLGLPPRVIPLLGLCVGRPDVGRQDPRPRIPRVVAFHRDHYRLTPEEERTALEIHDEEIIASNYYDGRRIPAADVGLERDPVPDGAYAWREHVARKQARIWWDDATPKLWDDLRALGWRGCEGRGST